MKLKAKLDNTKKTVEEQAGLIVQYEQKLPIAFSKYKKAKRQSE